MEHHDELKNHYYYDVLPPTQRALLDVLARQEWLESFYLVRGTALALYIGHRISIDFDFFSRDEFDNHKVISLLSDLGKFYLFEEARDTIHGSLDGVKLSFLRYRYPLIKPLHPLHLLKLADIFDIALMKLSAISGRGAKKDFIDFYFLLQRLNLTELLAAYSEKYGEGVSHHYHLFKSLVYFHDAEQEPMPRMIEPVKWADVKGFMVQTVKEIGFF